MIITTTLLLLLLMSFPLLLIGTNISDETIIGDIGGGDSQPLNHKEKRISWADVVSGNR
jgi:hypothetical protein